ncbi:hypothetical protein AB0I28_13240 [Phytomonospora sp. NPDC050363]|uniref:hypothetical protein n=1 Tax=Phytomonospora sp. NPDC050363 TaxID=3155642 RepID=UPI0033CA9660
MLNRFADRMLARIAPKAASKAACTVKHWTTPCPGGLLHYCTRYADCSQYCTPCI